MVYGLFLQQIFKKSQFILGMTDTSAAKWPHGFSSISFENSGQVTTDTGGGKCYLTHSSKTCQNSSIISGDCADQGSCSTLLSYLSNHYHSITSLAVSTGILICWPRECYDIAAQAVTDPALCFKLGMQHLGDNLFLVLLHTVRWTENKTLFTKDMSDQSFAMAALPWILHLQSSRQTVLVEIDDWCLLL